MAHSTVVFIPEDRSWDLSVPMAYVPDVGERVYLTDTANDRKSFVVVSREFSIAENHNEEPDVVITVVLREE